MVETEPQVSVDSVTFRLPDVGAGGPALAGLRLLPALSLPAADLDFGYVDGTWRLTLAKPRAARMEYRFQLRHPAGDLEEICDPGNPRRAPGAFGDKSVVEFPEYTAPGWLTADRVEGKHLEVAERVTVWTPADPDEPLPLLVAHDGPEYDRLAGLCGFAAALIHAGRLPPHRIALLAPGDRDAEYSANSAHSATLHDTVLPALRDAVAVRGPVVGMGASLGGLAMLHAQRRYPDLFGGLFLQSASFLDVRLDPQEKDRFSRFAQVSRYVAAARRTTPARTVPIVLTCGLAEENLANNRRMAAALRAQGYPARLHEVADAHNYIGWRDAFDPALADLLRTVWEA
jgi:enterochelin esterase-like enzyme